MVNPSPWTWSFWSFNRVVDGFIELAVELELDPSSPSGVRSTTLLSLCTLKTHESHSIQPIAVPTLPQHTIDTGLTRPCTMPIKQQTNITTEQTC
jgi:hypothetical protein